MVFVSNFIMKISDEHVEAILTKPRLLPRSAKCLVKKKALLSANYLALRWKNRILRSAFKANTPGNERRQDSWVPRASTLWECYNACLSPYCCLLLPCVVSLLLQGRIRASLKTREPEAGRRSSTLTLRYTGGGLHLDIHRTSFSKGSFQYIMSKCDVTFRNINMTISMANFDLQNASGNKAAYEKSGPYVLSTGVKIEIMSGAVKNK